MIINCICGLKKFEVEDNQISNNGRQVKCGVCSKEWFYKPESITEETSVESLEDLPEADSLPEEATDENFENIEETSTPDLSNKNLDLGRNSEIPIINPSTYEETGPHDYLKKKKSQSKRKRFLVYLLIILIFLLSFLSVPYKGSILSIFPELAWYFEGIAGIANMLFK